MGKVAKLSAEIRALRSELQPPPTPTPPLSDPPDDTEAPATVPSVDDPDPSTFFTGAPGTGFDGVPAQTQARPKFNQRVYAYVRSLPRGEQSKAMNALRQYVYGPGRMQPDDAIERYKERRVRDAQAPIGATDFDDLAASDSDAEDSDNDTASFQPRRRGPMSRFFDSDTLGGMGMCNDEDTLVGTGLTVSNIVDY